MQNSVAEMLKYGAVIVAVTGAFYVMQGNVNSLMKIADDHEVRIRTIEKDFLLALGEIKAEFQSVKSRLTAIEKAVKQ